MSYNASFQKKYQPFLDPGEDLLFLELTKTQDNYTTKVTRIAEGFEGPIDAVIVGNIMYILEYSGQNIYEVTFPENNSNGIEEPSGSLSALITVSPNPVKTEVTLTSNLEAMRITHARLHDLTGKVLATYENQGLGELTFSTEDLSSGVYFILVETTKGTALKKIVKE